MKKKFLFVRTFKFLKGGGPVPPLGILYLASALRLRFASAMDVKIIDLGLMSIADADKFIRDFAPDFVGLSAMSCEAGLMNEFARIAKNAAPSAVVIAGGPHATVSGPSLLKNPSIDIAVIGEGERTIVDLADALLSGGDLSKVSGIAFRSGDTPSVSESRPFIENLDDLPFPAWDLINPADYAAFPNWSGINREDVYAVISTSRGCPYGCYFCHNLFGKKVRARSPENVLAEMLRLRDEFGIREFHFVDDVFNFDERRAARICELIISGDYGFSLSFPNGLRADIMTLDLISLLKKAGAYKIHYGFETTSPRLQKSIGKNLDVDKAARIFTATSRSGITTGAYFMLGFPGQSRRDIEDAVKFAAGSALDAAYFFKATPYPGSDFHAALLKSGNAPPPESFDDFHFYSTGRSHGDLSEAELNSLIMMAQRKFFMNGRRLLRGFLKSPRKKLYAKNALTMCAILVQSYIIEKILNSSVRRKT